MGILVGLDIGIASVGWAVVKDDYTVLYILVTERIELS